MGAAMRYQPQGRVQINWANPITQGLAFAYVNGANAVGYSTNAPSIVPYAAAKQTVSPLGTGATATGTTSAYTVSAPAMIGRSYSLFAVATGPASGTQNVIDDDVSGGSRRFQFRLNAGKVEFITLTGSATVAADLIFPTALTAGDLARGFTMGATTSNVGLSSFTASAYQNGQKLTASMGAVDQQPPTGVFSIGARKSGGVAWTSGSIALVVGWSRTLSDAEMQSLAANPWQLFDAGSSSAYQAAIATTGTATGGATTNVSPGAGTLAIAGYAPAVTQSANQSVVPSACSLGLTGYAPSVVQSAGQNVLPGNGSIALTGYAPQVQQSANRAVSPGAAALAVVGYAPSISQSIVTTVAPQPGVLALTGFAPTVARTANASISPSVGALTITGYAPGVARTANQTVQAGAGGMTLTGYAPTVSQARVSAYPQLYLATILSQSTLYAVSPLVDALDVDAGQSALQASLAIATIMAESRIYATASLSDAATNQTASFV